jgi:hypothetical protein
MLKQYPELNERWVQTQIASDPELLGLGEVDVKGRPRGRGCRGTRWSGSREPGYIGLDTYDVLHQHLVSYHFTFSTGREARVWRSPH